jgi:prophage tail gpP-like protein
MSFLSSNPTSVISDSLQSLADGLKTQQLVNQLGHQPELVLKIQPLTELISNPGKINLGSLKPPDSIEFKHFIDYEFNSNILVPADSFTFKFACPDLESSSNLIEPGAIITLSLNKTDLMTGIIDTFDLDIDESGGEIFTIHGRDLMGQLDDQDAISFENKPIFGQTIKIQSVLDKLVKNTRIQGAVLQDMASSAALFATEPGESKLAALQRYLEPLNCLAWMLPDGRIKVGRPNFAQDSSGTIMCHKEQKFSNVTTFRISRSPTQIANIMVGIYAEQDLQLGINQNQVLRNTATGPARLLKLGHHVVKSVITSIPKDASAKSLQATETISSFGSGTIIEYAKRELARQNQKEVLVQVSSPGHLDPQGHPWKIDTVYHILSDRGNIDEKMYLFEVGFKLSKDRGQFTTLSFCKLNTIVSQSVFPGGQITTVE